MKLNVGQLNTRLDFTMQTNNSQLRGRAWAEERLLLLKTVGTEDGSLLPNGCHLYWEDNEVGGRRYDSDEVGGGINVWDTCLVQDSTLLAALTQEAELQYLEKFLARK